jgi:hypothetical protein
MSNYSITYSDEDVSGAEFEIFGNAEPYVPASMYGGPDHLGWPSEGGGVEIEEVRFLTAYDEDGDKINLTDERRQAITKEFSNRLDAGTSLWITIQELLMADANDRSEGNREVAAEARYDDLREARNEA